MTYMTRQASDIDTDRIVVVGGGAAGMMAAITAARLGSEVLLIEQMGRCGRKLRITGKGRCNLTNDSALDELMRNVTTNEKFLFAAFSKFSSRDVQDFFEELSVALKVERGKRVFPVSDKATDIVDAMVGACRGAGVKIIFDKVKSIDTEDGAVSCVKCEKGSYTCRAVILATGGVSYPQTGSDGSGFEIAKKLGHRVTALVPSLVPLTSSDADCKRMQGLSLKNVSMKIRDIDCGKVVYEDFGEMMFTHFGITGPMVLSASAHIRDVNTKKYRAEIDLKPALDEQKLDARLLSDFGKYSNRDFENALGDLLPSKMIDIVVRRSGIDGHKKVNSITREERAALLSVLKCFSVDIKGFRPISEAIVTKGGIDVREVSPKTMGSKLVSGLYFAGEILDVDAYTGGFNLQIAFSTGVLAGESAAYCL